MARKPQFVSFLTSSCFKPRPLPQAGLVTLAASTFTPTPWVELSEILLR
jgi:hypothetical protein